MNWGLSFSSISQCPILRQSQKYLTTNIIDVSPRSSTSIGAYPKGYCQKYLEWLMCPQGHPHQLEPILLKHFPMVLKAAAKIKARCETWNLWQSIIKIRRTHTLKIWIKGGDAVMVPVCSVCELIFKDILFFTLYDVHDPTPSNTIQTTQPTHPPHPYPL